MTRPDDLSAHRLEAREREEHWLHQQPPSALPAVPAEAATPEPLGPLMQRLARLGPTRHYRRHTLIAHEGERPQVLWLLRTGEVTAFSAGRTGREVIHARHGPGTLLGESLLLGRPQACSLLTATAVCVTLLSPPALEGFAQDHPTWWHEWQSQLLRRLDHCTRHAGRLALHDTAARLRAVLEDLAHPGADGRRHIRPRPTHAELAGLTGCSREMVTRLLKAMVASGRLRVEAQSWSLGAADPHQDPPDGP